MYVLVTTRSLFWKMEFTIYASSSLVSLYVWTQEYQQNIGKNKIVYENVHTMCIHSLILVLNQEKQTQPQNLIVLGMNTIKLSTKIIY